jgi:limonene 1,2-monooxygenase
MIEKLEQQSGGFGCILMLAHNWANFEATKRSYELFARHVLPRFNGSNIAREESLSWVRAHGKELMGKAMAAATETVQKHFAEVAAKAKK